MPRYNNKEVLFEGNGIAAVDEISIGRLISAFLKHGLFHGMSMEQDTGV